MLLQYLFYPTWPAIYNEVIIFSSQIDFVTSIRAIITHFLNICQRKLKYLNSSYILAVIGVSASSTFNKFLKVSRNNSGI